MEFLQSARGIFAKHHGTSRVKKILRYRRFNVFVSWSDRAVAQGSKNRSSTDGVASFTRVLKSMGGKRGHDQQTIRPGTEYCAAAITLYNFAFTSASIPPKYGRVNIWMLLPPSHIKYKIRGCRKKHNRTICSCVILSNYRARARDEVIADCLFPLKCDGNF